MLRSTILFLIVSLCYYSYSQDSEFLLLPKGASLSTVAWRDSIYRFPSFEPGRIAFVTGFMPEEKIMFNYNLYFMRIELISDNGDTVQLAPSPNVKHIVISNRQFVFSDVAGVVEVIVKPSLGLVAVHVLRDEKREYWPYRRVVDVRGEPAILDRYYKKVTTYRFMDDRMRVHPATKPIVLSFFRDHKKEINNYIDENKINFDNEADLVRLVNFCNNLYQER